MDKLQQIFLSEAQQLITDLERTLLEFERDLDNPKTIQEIFRAMHTIKGSASMFGFDALSTVTHDIESVYDLIRNGKLKASPEILAITLQVVDHLNALIADKDLANPQTMQSHQELIHRIKSIVPSAGGIQQTSDLNHKATKTFYIYCKPGEDTFKNGTNPLFLIDDLCSLGKCCVLPHLNEVPLFSDVSEKCLTGFEAILSTESDRQAISDVFMFVDGSCELAIEKLADDLLTNADLDRLKSAKSISQPALGMEAIRVLLQTSTVTEAVQKRESTSIAKVESSTIRVASEKLDELMNLISELVTPQARLTLISEQHKTNDLTSVSETIEKLTRRLRDNAFNICLVPLDTLAVRFQRLVRDVSKELHKEIVFTTEGLDTEIDRSVIEKISDPILHILRNCIDHGIELPETRLQGNKKAQGSIHFKAYHLGTHVHIEISDDGKGIDTEKIRQKAIAKGLISPEDPMNETQLLDLIFLPGFSTVDKVTDLSGRGVGMDVVKRNIESIRGEVNLKTTLGVGTVISIRLPLTLSIMDGMLVELGGAKYLLPLTVIDKCYEIRSELISSDHQQKHVFDDTLMPVLNLHEIFKKNTRRPPISQVIKINFDFPVGVTVDSIIGEYQAVMKPLGDLYQDRDEFSGATILGDGSVALVLDTTTLIRQLIKNTN